jgi:hypothetical protein
VDRDVGCGGDEDTGWDEEGLGWDEEDITGGATARSTPRMGVIPAAAAAVANRIAP